MHSHNLNPPFFFFFLYIIIAMHTTSEVYQNQKLLTVGFFRVWFWPFCFWLVSYELFGLQLLTDTTVQAVATGVNKTAAQVLLRWAVQQGVGQFRVSQHTHTHTHTCTHICSHTQCTCTHTRTYMHTHMHIHTYHMHTHIYTTCIHIHTHVHTHMHIHTHTGTYTQIHT